MTGWQLVYTPNGANSWGCGRYTLEAIAQDLALNIQPSPTTAAFTILCPPPPAAAI